LLAIEYLTREHIAKPKDPIPLFNRGLAFHSLGMLDGAVADGEAFLALESSGPWAEEVRLRTHPLANTLSQWRGRLPWFEAGPGFYLAHRKESAPEVFLAEATASWISEWRAGRVAPHDHALAELADGLGRKYSDPWLRHLLSGSAPKQAFRDLASAVTLNRLGQRDEGLSAAVRALSGFTRGDNAAGIARARLEMVYALSRSFRAEECLQQAAKLGELRAYPWIQGQLQIENAICLLHVGDLEGALRAIERAVNQTTGSGYETLRLRALGLLSSVLTQSGDTGGAVEANLTGISSFWSGLHPPVRLFQFYSELYLVAEEQELWYCAYGLSKRAVGIATLLPNRLTEAMARVRLAAYALRIGKSSEAAREARSALQLLEPFAGARSARDYRIESASIGALASLAANEVDQAHALLESINTEEAAGSRLVRLTAIRARGELAMRRGDWHSAKRLLIEGVGIAGQADLRLADARARSYWRRAVEPICRTLTLGLLEHDRDPVLALAVWQWLRGTPIRGETAQIRDLEQARDRLHRSIRRYSNSSVLTWAQLGNRVALWKTDDGGVRHEWSSVNADTLQEMADEFNRLLSSPRSSVAEIRERGSELYRALIAPVDDDLESGRRLLVQPDRTSVAFEALVTNNGQWLAERHAISTSPGIGPDYLLAERLIAPEKLRNALLVSDPAVIATRGLQLARLPDVRREVLAVASRMPSTTVLSGAEATRSAVSSGLQSADLFHFAGHAAFDGEWTKLLLAGEREYLDFSHIEQLAGRVKVAILSGCSTAAVEREDPWQAESLVKAFWQGGTPVVIASRWNAESAAAAELFQQFYSAWDESHGATGALHTAARSLRESHKYSHPYFWAAFHVFGSEPVDLSTSLR